MKFLFITYLLISFLYPQDSDISIENLLEKANEHYFNSEYDLANEYSQKILKLDPDNPEANFYTAEYYAFSRDFKKAVEWYYIAAKNNHPQAQYNYAWGISQGWLSLPIETLVEIIYWYEKSAYNGIDRAYANLAVFYDDESAEFENRRKIFSEMEVAANNGNAMAQYNMGWIYARGLLKSISPLVLMKDIDIAKSWFQKSASLGFEDSIIVLETKF